MKPEETLAQARKMADDQAYDAALALIEKVLADTSEDPNALVEKADILLMSGRVAEAIPIVEHALEIAPNHPRGLNLLVSACMTVGDHERAVTTCNRILEIHGPDASTLANKGISLRELGHPEQALPELERAVALDPESGIFWIVIGDTCQTMGQWQQAIDSFDRGLNLWPEFDPARFNRARCLVKLGLSDQVESELVQLAERDESMVVNMLDDDDLVAYATKLFGPWSAIEWLKVFASAVRTGKKETAVRAAEALTAMRPDDAVVWFAKGGLHEMEGNLGEAAKSYARAAELKPAFAMAHIRLGSALGRLGLSEDGIEAYETGLGFLPDEGICWCTYAGMLADVGRLDDAARAADQALQISPNDGKSWLTRAAIYARQQQHDDARRCVRQALSMDRSLAAELEETPELESLLPAQELLEWKGQ